MVTLVHIMWLKRIHHTLEPIIAAYSLILTFLTGISYLTLLTAALLLCCLKGQEDWTETKMQGWTLLLHSRLCVQCCYSSRWIEEIWSLANTARQKSPSSKKNVLMCLKWTEQLNQWARTFFHTNLGHHSRQPDLIWHQLHILCTSTV